MPARRLIACDSFDRVNDIVAELRDRGYTRLGQWSLPQVCYHLAAAVESVLVDPGPTEPTVEQAAEWHRFLASATSPDGSGIPAGRPLPGPTFDPPADCGDDQCDRLAVACRTLVDWPRPRCCPAGSAPCPSSRAARSTWPTRTTTSHS